MEAEAVFQVAGRFLGGRQGQPRGALDAPARARRRASNHDGVGHHHGLASQVQGDFSELIRLDREMLEVWCRELGA